MSIYIQTKPEIWTVMGTVKPSSRIVHSEDMNYSCVRTKCGVSRTQIPTPYFHVTRNDALVTCKKCLKKL